MHLLMRLGTVCYMHLLMRLGTFFIDLGTVFLL